MQQKRKKERKKEKRKKEKRKKKSEIVECGNGGCQTDLN
jgi:hypothetical protein